MTKSTTPEAARASFQPLGPIRKVSLSDSAAARISQMVHSGELKPGDRLPSERELSVMLGLSRTALREGLHLLETMGQLEASVGRGRFVTRNFFEVEPPPISAWVQLFHVRDVIAIRRLLEPQAIRELDLQTVPQVARSAEQAFQELERAQDRCAFSNAAALHARFHTALIEATPNPLLRQLCLSMLGAVRETQHLISKTVGAGDYSIELHKQILDVLWSGDLNAVAEAVAQHLVPEFQYPTADGG
ncbi:MAG: FadR/GntR family transcriptional regulator [Acidimicrobiales bacterium]